MQSRFNTYDSRWLRNQERGESYWKRYAEHSDSPLAVVIRQAFGLKHYHNPRTNRKPTKRYADGRQRGKK